ncbi:MAG: cysteine hydrolase family protein [Anaerolineales bacterium]|nr:cysteine hydrolase family protein [Anaerolineales bacterium]
MSNFPNFYDPSRIGTLYYPDVATIAAAAGNTNLTPAVQDKQNIHLVIIDMQVDFCHEKGSLYVPGAIGDIQRTIEFIYNNAEHITNITCSLDSHLPHQIFHPAWWADEHGNHPAPFTLISYEDIKSGKWRPLVAPVQSTNYVKKLEQDAKKTLTIWPYHVMIGSIGNALDPELFSAVMWHSIARKTQPTWLTKGSIPLTEHYSIIQPEVAVPNHPMGGKNKAFLDTLSDADVVVVAGEAESHCVLETVEDLVEDFSTKPDALQKIYFLRDCTSPVLHPDVDFHGIAMKRFAEFEKQGVNFIDSTDQLPVIGKQ